LPSVNRLYDDLKARGLAVVMVSFRESPATVKRAVEERGYTAPVLLDESGDLTGRVYGVWGPPTVYFIDKQGRLRGRIVGPRDWDTPQARTFIEAMLATP
jgi:cytochrome c biogenesis protein CcmG/thiol:disulfide interchange protein DsbE